MRRLRWCLLALLVALLGLLAPQPARAGDYPIEGGNEYHWFYISDALFPYVHTKTLAPNGHLKSTEGSAIVENDIAYIPSTETGRVIAYHLSDEVVLWTSPYIANMKGQPVDPVIVQDRLVITVADRIYVLNKNSGQIIKSIAASAPDGWRDRFPSSPLPWGNKVFASSQNYRFYGIVATDSSTTPFLAWNSGRILSGSPILLDRGNSTTSDDYIVFTADGIEGAIFVFRPSNNQIVKAWDTPNGIAASSVSLDGTTWVTTTKDGRIYKLNASSLSLSSDLDFYNANPGGWKRLRPMSYNADTGYVYFGVMNLDNGTGYVVRLNPNDGSYRYIYSSGYDITGAVTTFPGGNQLFMREDGLIIGRTTGAGEFKWYTGGNDSYRVPGTGHFSQINVVGGAKRIMLAPSDRGIELFEPAYPNLRATAITVTDGSGNAKTTFYKNETVRITGRFWNNGPVAANDVEHVLVKNGGWIQYASADYPVNGRPSVTYTYSARSLGAGTHTLYVRADPNNKVKEIVESDNNTPTVTIQIINRLPKADFSWSPGIPQLGDTIALSNASSDPDGDPLTYKWEYRKPGSSSWVQFSTAKNPTLKPDVAGTWTIRLTVTDDSGGSDSVQKTITVNRPPVANFTWSPSLPQLGNTVSFTNQSSDPDGDPLTYRWEYRKPGSSSWVQFSTAQNPTLKANVAGTWTIRLTVADNKGGSGSVTKTLVVNTPPVANFTWSPNVPEVGDTVSFTDASSDADGDPLTYRWEYRKPGSSSWVQFSTAKNPTLKPDVGGTWQIRLTVSDNKGGSGSITKSMTVVVIELTVQPGQTVRAGTTITVDADWCGLQNVEIDLTPVGGGVIPDSQTCGSRTVPVTTNTPGTYAICISGETSTGQTVQRCVAVVFWGVTPYLTER